MWQNIQLDWHFGRAWKTPSACSKCDQSFTDSGDLKIMKGSRLQPEWKETIMLFKMRLVIYNAKWSVATWENTHSLLYCVNPFMIFKSPLSVNDLSHLEQANGVFHALSKCHSSWISCHISNRQMTSLLCGSFHDFKITNICKWLVTFGTGKWSLSCSFNVPLQLNVFSHFEQANDFSPVWILSWFSNHNYL